MGMFDTVRVPCPKCGEVYEAQSKSGDCVLAIYDYPTPGAAKPAPNDVMDGVNRHAPFTCSNCGTIFKVPTMSDFESFTRDIAECDCEYNDNCPKFGSRHGQCYACKAREVLGFTTAQEYFDSTDAQN